MQLDIESEYTIKEAAKICRVDYKTMWLRVVKQKKIRGYRSSDHGDWRIKESDLHIYLENRQKNI